MDLFTPLRLGARAAGATIDAAVWIPGAVAREVVHRLATPHSPKSVPPADVPAAADVPAEAEEATTEQPAPRVRARRFARASEPQSVTPLYPAGAKIIDDTPRLVASDGPAEGAGAEVHVEEPWAGYAKMTAADVVDRLTVADPAAKAVVRLYEQQHKARETVLAAAG
ncbi:MAG: hypothetical protein JHC95_06930 [Solirubrobacteraceae bacterium]|nr:hypothetical protein [Solirubrobacteraceae bacterium]